MAGGNLMAVVARSLLPHALSRRSRMPWPWPLPSIGHLVISSRLGRLWLHACRMFVPCFDAVPVAAAMACVSQKWSKGKVKEKLSNLVLFDKASYEKMLTDIPKQRLITPSIISEKLKVNGSLARKAVKELVSKELIRPILTHKHQAIYTRATNT